MSGPTSLRCPFIVALRVVMLLLTQVIQGLFFKKISTLGFGVGAACDPMSHRWGVGSSLPSYDALRLKVSYQTWQPAPLPAKPSC